MILKVNEGEKSPYSLMLVLGAPAEFAGYIGMRFHCTIPVVDGGDLKVFPEDIWRESGVKAGWEEEDDSTPNFKMSATIQNSKYFYIHF
jgi:hypothetical protein